MNIELTFFITNIMLGIGLAMDAFSVSLANGLNEPTMKQNKMCLIAGIFALFQFLMPIIGFICVSTVANIFTIFQKFIPFIALILLCYIGTKMIIEGIQNNKQNTNQENSKNNINSSTEIKTLTIKTLLIQGIATSIDALSVGFTISSYTTKEAIFGAFLIGIVTFIICYIGLIIGKKAGTKLSEKASILGGIILITIGLQIFIKGII